MDLRERVAGLIAGGQSRCGSSRHFTVSPSFAVKLAKRVAVTGSVLPDKQGRPPGGGKLAAHMATLISWVEAEGDITMPELAAKLLAQTGVTVHPASLSRVLLAAGFSYKENTDGIGNVSLRRGPPCVILVCD
jgi:transposase